jgi:hypothetical protein
MLEIIVMIGVIGWFARKAKEEGENAVLWGFIGAISYYGPVLIFGRLVYPAIIRGSITYDNQMGYIVLGVILTLAIGIGCCFLASKMLLSLDENTIDNSNSVIPNIAQGKSTEHNFVIKFLRSWVGIVLLSFIILVSVLAVYLSSSSFHSYEKEPNLILPVDFNIPKDIPIYPKCKLVQYFRPDGDTFTLPVVNLAVNDSFDKVQSYYINHLKSLGWKVSINKNDKFKRVELTFKKGTRIGGARIEIHYPNQYIHVLYFCNVLISFP